LGSAVFDFTTKEDPKTYKLNLKNKELIAGKTVALGIVVFAGEPEIKVYMNSQLTQ
jgi:hypothetical protein